MKKNVFVSKMKLNGDTNEALAKALGVSPTTMSAKVNEKRGSDFTRTEILTLVDRWRLTPEEIIDIFFSD